MSNKVWDPKTGQWVEAGSQPPPPPHANPYQAPHQQQPQYGQPYSPNPGQYPGGPMPGGAMPGGPMPPTYLVTAIATTLLCCLPAGVVAIMYASQVSGKWASGDFIGAMEASQNARKRSTISVVLAAIMVAVSALMPLLENL